MKSLQIRTDTVAYKEGQQAFHDDLDILDDNPYRIKNMFGVLPREWFEWHQAYEEEYTSYNRKLDASTKTNP